MDGKGREIFRAIHEGRWLKIEYCNKSGDVTSFWGAVKSMNPQQGLLTMDGLHLTEYRIAELNLRFESIRSASVLDGTWCEINSQLVQDIELNSEKYQKFFGNIANLKILNYLEMCYKMDTTPYCKDFQLVHYLDDSQLRDAIYRLSNEQFDKIVQNFQYRSKKSGEAENGKINIRRLVMNILSIHTKQGLYVLAYRELNLDVKKRCLRPAEDITICREFMIDGGTKESVRRFLDADDYDLLEDFEANQELIKDKIMKYSSSLSVDDIPYILGLGMDLIVNLNEEYKAIFDMFDTGKVTVPFQAFFGNLLKRPRRIKAWPIALLDHRINMDQLLAINNAMKYPTAYIQGPPGTGKTNTIINTIVTAFFNERTVLFSSYNNHPLDGVVSKLTRLEYNGKRIPFPVLRLGNQSKMEEALDYIQNLREQVRNIKVFGETLDKRKDSRVERAKQLSGMLKNYEEYLDLREREETLQRMVDYQNEHHGQASLIPFTLDISGRQMERVHREINKRGDITEEAALMLLDTNEAEFYQYLYFTSARYIKRLEEDRYRELRGILEDDDKLKRLNAFSEYLKKTENVKQLQRVFPIMVTTCLSAHKLGEPTPVFDMVVIDEASQCNIAVSLIPILRGENLMLVGDPQQLSPVILLDDTVNRQLRKKYQVPDEYDYRNNSIYKAFLASDSVSDETLLHNHYRCNKKIIDFNNRKYYSSKLNILSKSNAADPLVFVDVPRETAVIKNTSWAEADQIIRFLKENRDKTVGIITPFVNQKKLIEEKLKENGFSNVTCGTVHSFQGDEKDVILFSTTIGANTYEGTYGWLKNNRELINVATSRAREKLVVLGNREAINRLHQVGLGKGDEDDFYELTQYVQKNGKSEVTPKQSDSRALGVKPYSTEMEEAFLQSLTHALGNIWLSQSRFNVKREVAISQVFMDDYNCDNLFYTGRFDFVVFEKMGNQDVPILAIELDGKEHFDNEVVKIRDQRKNAICRSHNLQLIRVENAYARRYNYIKNVLADYFQAQR